MKLTDLMGFLLKPGQGDQLVRVQDSGSTDLTGLLLNLSDAKKDTEVQKLRSSGEENSEELDETLVQEKLSGMCQKYFNWKFEE